MLPRLWVAKARELEKQMNIDRLGEKSRKTSPLERKEGIDMAALFIEEAGSKPERSQPYYRECCLRQLENFRASHDAVFAFGSVRCWSVRSERTAQHGLTLPVTKPHRSAP